MKINGETHYLWRAVDHEGEVLEDRVSKHRNRKAALVFLKKIMKQMGPPPGQPEVLSGLYSSFV